MHKHPYLRFERELLRHLPENMWTENASDASFFVVPHAYTHNTCRYPQYIETVGPYVKHGLARMLEHVQFAWPFFNRSGGRDHIIILAFENGPLCDCTFRRAMLTETRSFGMLQAMIKVVLVRVSTSSRAAGSLQRSTLVAGGLLRPQGFQRVWMGGRPRRDDAYVHRGSRCGAGGDAAGLMAALIGPSTN